VSVRYASGDVQSLFQLRAEQRVKADETPAEADEMPAEARCVAASLKSATFYKKFMTTTTIEISNVGRFIGPGGANIARLQVLGSFYQTRRGTRDNLHVYADDKEQLAKAVAKAAAYRCVDEGRAGA
jgi:hypothetical protein